MSFCSELMSCVLVYCVVGVVFFFVVVFVVVILVFFVGGGVELLFL